MPHDDRGHIVPALLLALGSLGLLAAGLVALTVADLRLARGHAAYERNRAAAHRAIIESVTRMEPTALLSLPTQAPGLVGAGPGGGGVVRLHDNLFLSLGGRVAGLRFPAGLLFEIVAPAVPPGGVVAPVVTGNAVGLRQRSQTGCSAPADTARVVDPGDVAAAWIPRATVTLARTIVAPAPTVVGGACIPSPFNWGAPNDSTSACWSHRPVVHAPGGLSIRGGTGQGVLIVDGPLTITAPFDFHGIIVATGVVSVRDAVRIDGSLLASSLHVDEGFARAGVEVTHSVCELRRLLLEFGQIATLPDPAWFLGS